MPRTQRQDAILNYLEANPRSDIVKIMAGIKAGPATGYTRQEIEQRDLYQLSSVQGLVKSEMDHVTKVYSLSVLGTRAVSLMKNQYFGGPELAARPMPA